MKNRKPSLNEITMDVGYALILRKAAALGKNEAAIASADEEYRRILRGQDNKTARCPFFQQIAALAAIETHLDNGGFGV